MLLKILLIQCIDSPQIKNDLAPNVNSVGVEKPWSRFIISLEISLEIITSDMQMTPPYGRKQRKTKEPLDESETGE